MTATLADRLLSAAPALNSAAVDDEFRDPFWWDRYGERGLRFAREDGLHHFNYLAEAVRAESPHVLVKYARWLRSVLVHRGMCSEHLADGLRIRARHIAALAGDDAAPALALLDAAVDALTYTEPPAAGLVPPPGGDHDARHILSYLADALAFDRPDVLHEHLAWRAGFDRRRGHPDARLPASLAALVARLTGPAQVLLHTAVEALP